MAFEAYQIGTVLHVDSRGFAEKYGKVAGPYFKIEICDTMNQQIFTAESLANDGGYDLNGLIVTSVEWEENDCQADMMTLTVQNPDLQLQDSRLFSEGNYIDLWMGYDGLDPDYMGRGIIVEVESVFQTGSMCSLNITCYDIAYFMMEESRAEIVAEGTQWWENRRERLSTEEERLIDQQVDAENPAFPEEGDSSSDRDNDAVDSPGGSGVSDATVDVDSLRGEPSAEDIAAMEAAQTELQTARESTRTRLRQEALERHPFEMARTTSPSRRRRRQGKVWRNMTDSEIVASIYESYNVVPFVDTTGERSARGSSTIVETETEGPIFNTSHPDSAEERRDVERRSMEAYNQTFTPEGDIDDIGNTQRPTLDVEPVYAYAFSTRQSRVVETDGRRVVQKAGTSDWEFIKQLASNHGYIVFVFYSYEARNWCGYWGPMSNVPQVIRYELKFNEMDESSLESFRPKTSMRGQSTEIDLSYVNPRDRRHYRIRVSMDNVSRYSTEFRGPNASQLLTDPIGDGPDAVLTIHGQRVSVPVNRPFVDAEDARRWLMAFWMRHASEFCEAEGKLIVGVPDIHARHRHGVRGVGRFGGEYFFTKVNHKMNPGAPYETTFSGFRVTDIMMSTEPVTASVTSESDEVGHVEG